jgi:DNA polymerase III subunit chi
MTRIDFYVLEDPALDRHDRMLCRVIEKAWQQGHGIYVHCDDLERAREFDDLLWRFQDTSFVPHALDGEGEIAADTPILIGTAPQRAAKPDVLINLSSVVSEAASSFTRVVETAGYDDTTRGAARARYRHYQESGFPLNTHKLSR